MGARKCYIEYDVKCFTFSESVAINKFVQYKKVVKAFSTLSLALSTTCYSFETKYNFEQKHNVIRYTKYFFNIHAMSKRRSTHTYRLLN